MKKIICLTLCFSMLLSIFSFNAGAAAYNKTEGTYMPANNENPVVVVRGMDFSDGLKLNAGTPDEKNAGVVFSAGELVKTLGKAFLACVKGFSFSKGVDVILDYAYSLFADYACDNTGESLNKNVSSPLYTGNASNYPELCGDGGSNETGLVNACVKRYGAERTYFFIYDWRLDPVYNATLLSDMINLALAENSCERVNLICNSMGGIVSLAYLSNFGSGKIENLVSNSATLYGADVATELFCGDICFQSDAAVNYLSYVLPEKQGLISFLEKTGFVTLLCKLLNSFVNKYKDALYDKVLTPVFGTMPAFWSLVQPEKYSEAREFIFGGKEDEYSALLQKTDSFQLNTVQKRKEILDGAINGGMRLGIVTSYNTPNVCVYPSGAMQGDGTLETSPMSLNAIVSRVGGILTEDELNTGDPKYISADKCINASTCAYPDYTWFIKDAPHVGCKFGSDYTELIFSLAEADFQPRTDTWQNFPQFLQSDGEQNLTPLK